MRVRIVARAAITAIALLQPATAATEKNWFGKFDLVDKTAGRSVRFFARGDGLSLFAAGDFKTVLLGGYYAKAKMSVGYVSITCPSGITGPCGRVNFVSVDAGNNF
jgi:hypothetical protein